MTLSRREIQAKSDAKRGVKIKGFKLPIEIIEEIEELSKVLNIPQNQLIIKAFKEFKSRNQ